MPVVGKTLALQGDTPGTIETTFNTFIHRVKSVEGHLIMVFSNRDFEPTKHNKIWRYLFLEKLIGRAR